MSVPYLLNFLPASPFKRPPLRVPVSVILEQIAEGESWGDILTAYPELQREDIQAAIYYAKASLDHSEVRVAGA
ncbi:MAG: DUF433 domain-containing protein [Desulfobacterales bacterium]|uniref:DUF433 domain-containing protein n=1 Tax=Candidatus Desulfatibia vada TaxID=2841696 RepID=A0A8J6P5I5_9BACT|nr:DUF433 domain-containing protein [Candidatus Desulfatibia vada]MBL7218166.1 DUF433 domain-containing protein [Desulfobacteraceae bacterium]